MEGLSIALPIFGAVLAWLANEWRKREADIHLRKEEHYKALLLNFPSFFEGGDTNGRKEFLRQLQLCWLYCPEDVIRKANDFMATVHEGSGSTQDDKSDAMRALVIEIRRDLLPWYRRNGLSESDVKMLMVRTQ